MVRVRLTPDAAFDELTWEAWEERARAGRIPGDAWVQAAPLTGDAWVRADSLAVWRTLSSDGRAAFQRGFTQSGPPWMTALLVGVQIRIWWIAQVPEVREALLGRFTKSAPALYEDGAAWRLWTMGLLHVDIWHVGVNLLWMAYAGQALERALGRTNLVVLYALSVFGGSALSTVYSPDRPSLGASGGVFGLIAAVTVFGFTHAELLPERGRRIFGIAMLPYLVLMFASGLSNARTDNWCHFGGLVTGLVMALVLDPPGLQRRPSWNRGVQAVAMAASLLAAAIPAALGPALHPLRDSAVAETIGRPGATETPIDTAYRPLHFQVPVGWYPGSAASGAPGFVSTAGRRALSVTARLDDAPQTVDQAAAAWAAQVRDAFPDAIVTPGAPIALAEREATTQEARFVADGIPMVSRWAGVTRGRWTLVWVWEVDAASEARLAPLAERVRQQVTWGDPTELVDAHAAAALPGAGDAAQVALARAELAVGDVAAALPRLDAVRDRRAASPDAWIAALEAARWYPDRAPLDPQADRALAERPETKVLLEVVRAYEATGNPLRAAGLLEVGWERAPGDRTLARARRSRGLPTGLTPEGEAWSAVYDRRTGAPRPAAERAERDAWTLDRAGADRAGAALEAELNGLWADLVAAIPADPERAIGLLLVLKHGQPPADAADARAGLARDLASETPPAWLPADRAAVLRAEPRLAAALAGE